MSDDPASRDAFQWELRRSLVERLRIPWEGMGDMANQQRAEAAMQISTMMNLIEAWRQAMQKAERDIADMRARLTEANLIAAGMQDEIERLRADRDEARREVCAWAKRHFKVDAQHVARERGWDCYGVTNDQLPDGRDNISSQETA